MSRRAAIPTHIAHWNTGLGRQVAKTCRAIGFMCIIIEANEDSRTKLAIWLSFNPEKRDLPIISFNSFARISFKECETEWFFFQCYDLHLQHSVVFIYQKLRRACLSQYLVEQPSRNTQRIKKCKCSFAMLCQMSQPDASEILLDESEQPL